MTRRRRRWIATLAVAVVSALSVAPTALAQSSGTGYGGEGGVAGQVSQGGQASQGGGPGNEGGVAGTTAGGNGNAASQASPGENALLAFTGLDLALIAGGGLVLLAGGVAMRGLVDRPQA